MPDKAEYPPTWVPLSETAYLILLAVLGERHGYGIMQEAEALTEGRIKIGPGTLYGTLAKMETDSLIAVANEIDRRKVYRLTDAGRGLLEDETDRLGRLSDLGRKAIGGRT